MLPTKRPFGRVLYPIVGLVLLLLALLATPARAQIYRWDNNQLIPGTAGITPAPGINLSDLEHLKSKIWNSPI